MIHYQYRFHEPSKENIITIGYDEAENFLLS